MKKLLLSVLLLACPVLQAEQIGDMIKATILSNITASALYGLRAQDRGQPKLALTDAILNLGSYKGSSLLNFQAGFFGDPNKEEGEPQVANWIFGSQFRIDPFIKAYLPLDTEWVFLKSIQHGPSAFYDVTNRTWRVSYQVGLSFGVNPNQI